jgi:drug/metabolite transporter (DMT)-like permease
LIRLSWIIFLHAALLSIESIAVEIITTQLLLDPLVVAGSSIMIAGAALLVITVGTEGKKSLTVFRSLKYLLPASGLVSLGVFTWYDSVSSVGASKEGLLAGPLETVVILVLARVFLNEKLSRLQTAGVLIALVGFFATVMSAGDIQLLVTWGDIEAIVSALSFGAAIILISILARTYSSLQVTSASLLISGLILAAVLWTFIPSIKAFDWAALSLFSILPLAAGLTYVVGLRRIGASLTSTIASFSILLTLLFQLSMLAFGAEVILPSQIPSAIAGGVLGVFGIYLIHRQQRH